MDSSVIKLHFSRRLSRLFLFGRLAAKPHFSRPASWLSTKNDWRPAKSAAWDLEYIDATEVIS